jgi:hypothetical protein
MIASSTIYGQSLLHFTEAFEPFNYFQMTPNFSDNYTPVVTSGYSGIDANFQAVVSGYAPQGTYMGVFHNDESSVKDAMGNLVSYQRYLLWAEENLDPGWFIGWSNTTFRIVQSNDWPRQAGFTEYVIERMVGSDGQGTVPSGLNDGSGYYQ